MPGLWHKTASVLLGASWGRAGEVSGSRCALVALIKCQLLALSNQPNELLTRLDDGDEARFQTGSAIATTLQASIRWRRARFAPAYRRLWRCSCPSARRRCDTAVGSAGWCARSWLRPLFISACTRRSVSSYRYLPGRPWLASSPPPNSPPTLFDTCQKAFHSASACSPAEPVPVVARVLHAMRAGRRASAVESQTVILPRRQAATRKPVQCSREHFFVFLYFLELASAGENDAAHVGINVVGAFAGGGGHGAECGWRRDLNRRSHARAHGLGR